MVTTTLEKLRDREGALKQREQELTASWHAASDSPAGAKTRDQVGEQLREVTAELTRLSPEIAQAKEQRKKDRLDELLRSAEYRHAVEAGAAALALELGPWLPILTTTVGATRQGLAVPLPPASKSALYLEGKAWINVLVRRGIVDVKALPSALRALIAEVGK